MAGIRPAILCPVIVYFLSAPVSLKAQPPLFPLKTGPGGHFLADQRNRPVFLNGDAAWRLSYKLAMPDVVRYLLDRQKEGYNTLFIEITPDLVGPSAGDQPDLYGDHVFYQKDIAHPNEHYFRHVDSVLEACRSLGFVVILFPMYLGCCHDGWTEILDSAPNNDLEKCRTYGRWIARRYMHLPNIIWADGGDHPFTPASIAIAEGIAQEDSIHLQTFHGQAAHTSTEVLPDAKWLGLSMVYTYYPDIWQGYPNYQVYALEYQEWYRGKEIPFIMAESCYEWEREETTQTLRRQAWWSLTSGACGHIFGNRDDWQLNKSWEASLHSPGNRSMKVFWHFLNNIRWYDLRPDWAHNVIIAGRGVFNNGTSPGGEDYLTAALSEDGRLMVAYLPSYRRITVNLERFKGRPINVSWYDPTTGSFTKGEKIESNRGVVDMVPPGLHNRAGFQDWVLLMRAGQ